MGFPLKIFALAALFCAPMLAACTQSPETTFEWGVNDQLPRHYARGEVTRSDLPRRSERSGRECLVREWS